MNKGNQRKLYLQGPADKIDWNASQKQANHRPTTGQTCGIIFVYKSHYAIRRIGCFVAFYCVSPSEVINRLDMIIIEVRLVGLLLSGCYFYYKLRSLFWGWLICFAFVFWWNIMPMTRVVARLMPIHGGTGVGRCAPTLMMKYLFENERKHCWMERKIKRNTFVRCILVEGKDQRIRRITISIVDWSKAPDQI